MDSKGSRPCPAGVPQERAGQLATAGRARSAVRWDGGVYLTSDVPAGAR